MKKILGLLAFAATALFSFAGVGAKASQVDVNQLVAKMDVEVDLEKSQRGNVL